MKELSIEQKAKRYDEDDRIRKALIRFHKSTIDVDGIKGEDIIAWLEKQRKIVDYYEDRLDECACKYFNKGYKHALEKQGAQIDIVNKEYWRGYREGKQEILDKYAELEKQSEQKLADKVEPIFNVGDWCIDNEDGVIFQIVKVLDNTYTYKTNEGKEYSCSHYSLENDAHLWTIQDAKDGDVLFCKGTIKNSNEIKYERICLFNNLDNAFFTLTKTSNYVEEYDIDVNIDYPDNTVPATKEQKEILFMTMADTGYTFDFEKKELKKIEPIFNVGDKNVKVY